MPKKAKAPISPVPSFWQPDQAEVAPLPKTLSTGALGFLISILKTVRLEAFDENVGDLGLRAQELSDWVRAEYQRALGDKASPE